MRSQLTFANGIAAFGAWAAIPAFYALTCYAVLVAGYGVGWELSLWLSGAVAFAVYLDSTEVERTFRESRAALSYGATYQEAAGLLCRLSARYCLVLVTLVAAFELSRRHYGLSERLSFATAGHAAGLVYLLFRLWQNESVHIRGQELITLAEAKRRAGRRRLWFAAGLEVIPGLVLPWRVARYALVLLGAQGSGKTTLLKHLLRECSRHGRRFVLFNGKADLLPDVAALRLGVPVYDLNAFDDSTRSHRELGVYRCTPVDIAALCRDIASCENLAAGVVPVETMLQAGRNDPFWPQAAFNIIAAALVALMYKKKGKFSFADFIRAFERADDLLALLDSNAYGKQCLMYLKSKGNSSGDVLKTLIGYMRRMRTVAAATERSTTPPLDLARWAKGEGMLVMTLDERVRQPLDVYYRLLFGAIVQTMLAPGQEENGYSFFVLDEIREAGYWPSLSSLLVRGRSKKVVALLAYQSQAGFESAMGSKDVATEIWGLCQTQIIAKLAEGYTMEYVSKAWSRHEIWVSERDPDGVERRQRVEKDAVMPSEFGSVQAADEELGMSGWLKSSEIDNAACRFHLTPRQLFGPLPRPLDIPNVCEVPNENQELSPWTPEEREGLGLPPLPEDQEEAEWKDLEASIEVQRFPPNEPGGAGDAPEQPDGQQPAKLYDMSAWSRRQSENAERKGRPARRQ